MALFQFGRKINPAKEYSLEEIPIFASLTASEQRLIEKKIRIVEYKRGDLVYEEGTPAEAFYVVISGRFRLFSKGKPGKSEETLIYFYRGDHFGETSLLTGRLHSASIEAKHDGLVLKLDKADFLRFVNEMPSISLHLNRSLGHRLTRTLDAHSRHEVKIVTLFSKETSSAPFRTWLDFSRVLAEQTQRKAILVDFISPADPMVREEFQIGSLTSFEFSNRESNTVFDADLKENLVRHPSAGGFHYLHALITERDKDEKKLMGLLTFLTYRYDYLLLRFPSVINAAIFKALKQSDVVYIYSGPSSVELAESAAAAKEFQQGFGFSAHEIRIIVPEVEGKKGVVLAEEETLLGFRIFSFLPSRTAENERYHSKLTYLAKELSGSLVGLALGSGAAYGLAHIGVLQVLESEGIGVDVVAGSSIGALVGALWASGHSAAELVDLCRTIDKRSGFFKLLGFRDMSIAHHGFFKGHQVSRFIESYLGNKTFQDLKMPVKIVATDLFTSEEVVLDSGSVVDAIRASISIPGIFRPVFCQGRYLIDGGVIDPLPVRVLTSMGVKKIIAVNVLPGPKDRIERNKIREENRLQRKQFLAHQNIWNRLVNQGLDKVYDRYAVNIFNVIMSTIQFMEYEMAESSGIRADVLIHPIVREAHWAEFYSPDKFIKIGEERTREQLEEMKRLLAE